MKEPVIIPDRLLQKVVGELELMREASAGRLNPNTPLYAVRVGDRFSELRSRQITRLIEEIEQRRYAPPHALRRREEQQRT